MRVLTDKSAVLAHNVVFSVAQKFEGRTLFAMACGCSVIMSHADAIRASVGLSGLSDAIFNMLRDHQCPTRTDPLLPEAR